MSYLEMHNRRVTLYGQTEKERILNEGIRNFEAFLKSAPNKENIKVGNINYQGVIQDVAFNDSNKDNKILLVNLDTPFDIGTVCEFNNEKWLIVGLEKNVIPTHKTFKITQTNNTLTFYKNHISSTPIQIPCIIESNVRLNDMGTAETKYIIEPNGVMTVKLSNTEITKHIARDDIYKMSEVDNYKVIDVNRVIEQGLIILKMEWTAEEQAIPEIVEPIPIVGLSVEILGVNAITKGSSKTYTAVFKQNDIVVSDASIFYLTADDGVSVTTLAEITSQDSVLNTCIIKANNLGYVKLWVKNVGETIVSEPYIIQIKNLF